MNLFFGIVELAIALCLVILNIYAVVRIIAQAGYSRWWILVPFTPFFLWIISIYVMGHDTLDLLNSGFVVVPNFSSIKVLFILDLLSVFASWLFFIVFAFSTWPVSQSNNQFNRSEQAPGRAFEPTKPLARSTGPVGGQHSSSARPSSAPSTKDSTNSRPPEGRKTVYCTWCAASIPGNRALGHDCGPRDRPVVYCRYCGVPFENGATTCVTCGAAT